VVWRFIWSVWLNWPDFAAEAAFEAEVASELNWARFLPQHGDESVFGFSSASHSPCAMKEMRAWQAGPGQKLTVVTTEVQRVMELTGRTSTPSRAFRSVDLPQPVLPTMATGTVGCCFTSPRRSRLSHPRAQADGHFPLRFLDGGFEVLPEFEAVLNKVIQPIADLFQLRRREALQFRLDLLNFAHGCRVAQHPAAEKLKLGKRSEGKAEIGKAAGEKRKSGKQKAEMDEGGETESRNKAVIGNVIVSSQPGVGVR
jgi:hypothetical protein